MHKSRHSFKTLALLLLFAAMGAGGCASERATPTPTPIPSITPVQNYTEPESVYNNPGSLYSETGPSMLFEDSRARRVGDLILINIVENTKAQTKANTTAKKENTHELGIAALFSQKEILGAKVGAAPMLSAESTSDFTSTGTTKRENYVTTTVGGQVIQVLPNGVLQVAGVREVKVNEETEYMVITGLVRTNDIMSDNSVMSTQLANSKIEYYGKGVLADKQKPGWLTRLLDNIWPI